MADTFNVALKRASDSAFSPLVSGLTSPSYTFTGLDPNTAYVYEVSITTGTGTSNFSFGTFITGFDGGSPSPTPSPTPSGPVLPPIDLLFNSTDTTMTISWIDLNQ